MKTVKEISLLPGRRERDLTYMIPGKEGEQRRQMIKFLCQKKKVLLLQHDRPPTFKRKPSLHSGLGWA